MKLAYILFRGDVEGWYFLGPDEAESLKTMSDELYKTAFMDMFE